MPIYEYECGACGRVHEILQKMSDNALTDCPECAGKLHKRISQCTFHLKGSGWYVTDYANSAEKTSSSPAENSKQSKTGTTEASSTTDAPKPDVPKIDAPKSTAVPKSADSKTT